MYISTQINKKKRNLGLDLIRATAIILVMMEHSFNLFPDTDMELFNVQVFDGVMLFFVLSGFLIGRILLRQFQKPDFSAKDLSNFLARRWLRTLPNYFLVLISLAMIFYVKYDYFNLKELASFSVFVQNINEPHSNWFFAEAWSLSIEEWFYLLVPVALFIFNKAGINIQHSILIISMALLLWSIYARSQISETIKINSLETWDQYIRKTVVSRADAVIWGVLGAYVYSFAHTYWTKYRVHTMILAVIGLVSMKIYQSTLGISELIHFSTNAYMIITPLFIIMLFPSLMEFKLKFTLLEKAIVYFSVISYSLYLVNYSVVQQTVLPYLKTNLSLVSDGWSSIIVFWLMSILLSHLLYTYFEQLILRWRDKKLTP